MKNILVIDSGNQYYIDFFNSIFSTPRLNLRVCTDIQEATAIINVDTFHYIFIGDIEDLTWFQEHSNIDDNINICFYTQNVDLSKKQVRTFPSSVYVPFTHLKTFIEIEIM